MSNSGFIEMILGWIRIAESRIRQDGQLVTMLSGIHSNQWQGKRSISRGIKRGAVSYSNGMEMALGRLRPARTGSCDAPPSFRESQPKRPAHNWRVSRGKRKRTPTTTTEATTKKWSNNKKMKQQKIMEQNETRKRKRRNNCVLRLSFEGVGGGKV